jgi:hypothetical protein
MRRPIALLLIAASAALTALFLSPGALAADGNDDYANATALSPGANGPFDIEPAGDTDWYLFSLSELTVVLVETSGPSGSTTMYLFDQNLSYIAYDSGTAYPWSSITGVFDLGTYYLRVEAANGTPNFTGNSVAFDAAPPASTA